MDTPETSRDKSTPSRRVSSWLGIGGGAGIIAVIVYAIATSQHKARTLTESVILVGLLAFFAIVLVIGIVRWASRRPNYPYQIGWRAFVASWAAGVIVLVVIDSILYRQFGYFGFHNRWANGLLMGAVCGICGAIASRARVLRPKDVDAAEPPLVELIITSDAPQAPGRTEFTLTLKDYPANRKIRLIKVIREMMGLGIKQAKDLVEASPSSVRVRIAATEVDVVKKKLEDAGAKVEIK